MGKQKKQRSKANTIITIVIVLVFVIGLGVLLYPTVADLVNSFTQSRVVANYYELVKNTNSAQYAKLLADAQSYNEQLLDKPNRFFLSQAELEEYNSLLNVDGTEAMGVLEIPKINVRLPIYHGTSEGVLQVGVGHLEGSSLPVGGPSTHTVISGHRGLPSSTLLSNLDKLEIGDTFQLIVLNERLTYQVDQILTVLPEETAALAIEPGQDYCTLVTCTPYGINSHRLLVRGTRIETVEEKDPLNISPDARTYNKALVALLIASPAVLVILIGSAVVIIRKNIRR